MQTPFVYKVFWSKSMEYPQSLKNSINFVKAFVAKLMKQTDLSEQVAWVQIITGKQ